jgi:serine/threonine-protein kinase
MDGVMQATGVALASRDEPMFRPGEWFLRFRIVRLIGRGGISEVYEVIDRGRRCALKVLQRRFVHVARQKRRAAREGRLLVQIQHPNVIDVQEVGIHEGPGAHEGIFFIRMELLHGVELRTAMHRIGPMSVALAGAWIRQAAHGAHQCHAIGIVHRDIKPENIFLEPPRTVKILDLGIAAPYGNILATFETDEVKPAPIGTAVYMAPEIATGDETATPATDVYALGLTLREMLTAQNFFCPEGSTYDYWAIVRRQALGHIPRLTEEEDGVPDYLADVIARALSKNPRERQPNGLAFANEIDAACKRYAREHPDEEPNPGEPAIAWLLEQDEVPSFGTGPSSAPGARRPTQNECRSGRVSGPRLSASKVAVRFHTRPIVQLIGGEVPASAIAAAVVDLDPEGVRITDVMPPPLALRVFDTISLPPEQRDPTAVFALAPYRRPRAVRPPISAVTRKSAPIAALPPAPSPSNRTETKLRSPWAEPSAAPPTVRRGARAIRVDARLLALPMIAFCVVMSIVIARAAQPVAPPVVEGHVAVDAGAASPVDAGSPPADAAPDVAVVAPAGSALARPDGGPSAADAGTKPTTKPALPHRPLSALRPRAPTDIF